MGRKIPAAPGDDRRGRRIDPNQAAKAYAADKHGGGQFYCASCAGYFPMKAIDLHAGH